MSREVVITTDSTVDLSPELIARFGIEVVPLYVEMDGKTYRDGVDVQPQALYDYYSRTGKLARSSAANIEDYTALFARLSAQGKAVVHINLSSETHALRRSHMRMFLWLIHAIYPPALAWLSFMLRKWPRRGFPRRKLLLAQKNWFRGSMRPLSLTLSSIFARAAVVRLWRPLARIC